MPEIIEAVELIREKIKSKEKLNNAIIVQYFTFMQKINGFEKDELDLIINKL